jgi:lambda family phage portal protein
MMLRWLLGDRQSARAKVDAREARAAAVAQLLARYDAAGLSQDTKNHWAAADNLSAASANSRAVRDTLRRRSRYETANNSYANGMVRTLAYHCVGTGPTLAIDQDTDFARECEDRFGEWSEAVDLAGKLRTMREARARDGEVFGLLTTNPAIKNGVKLDLVPIECDRVTDPRLVGYSTGPSSYPGGEIQRRYNDGITYDAAGNPTTYTILDDHPGEIFYTAPTYRDVSAEFVLHWFRQDRPGQRRGIPEITPALPLYAILRRYTLAVLTSAEVAAMMSLFLKTTSPAINPASVDPYDLIDLQRNTMMTLPDGWDVQQLKAEQPTTTHDAFASTVLREIARCLDMPYSIAVGDSSKLNYSSGRLDHQTYHRAIGVDRVACERSILDRLFAAWFDEALLTPGLFAGRPDGPLRSSWDWPPFAHVDPRLEAEATQIDLANGLTSLPSELAIRGRRWEAEFARAARSLGVTVPEYQRLLRQRIFAAGGAPAENQSAGTQRPADDAEDDDMADDTSDEETAADA